ncbi:HalOD1 output domain-containing protein [Halalkalicoccus ordinarius]|uniref:HalOD1 output domain-containing protein n=1 Tax=Halalkalicoccus ordinarius TaxID=3116651 RepID=UPI00300F68EE
MTDDLTTSVASLEESGIVREWDDRWALSATVVETVGTLTGRDPTTMEPLYGWIDPDALADLFGECSSEGAVSVSFRYLDCVVTVTDDGFVHATPAGDYSN